MPPIYIAYLNRLDIDELNITDDEILSAIEASLASQGRGETVIEPRVHLEPGVANGHFNVLRGAIKAPIDSAGVKIVGDFVDNYKLGFPSELAILALFDPRTGAPKAILDASGITDMRTGAVTAIGAKHLARKNSKILGHIGARGTAYWNVRLLNHLFDFDEIRVHSRREESRNNFAERLSRDLGKKVIATEDWKSCVEGADIVVEASRLDKPTPLLRTEWIKQGAFVVPYGTMSAIELSLTDIMAKLVVDDWGQCKGGKFGSLRAHVEAGKLSEDDVTCGTRADRRRSEARPAKRCRDQSVLASRALAVGYRARPRHAGKIAAAGHRATPALCLIGRRPREKLSHGVCGQCTDVFGQSSRPPPHGRSCLAGSPVSCVSSCVSPITRFPCRWPNCGHAAISPAPSCADFPMRLRRRSRGRWPRPFLLGRRSPAGRSMRRVFW